MPFVAELYFDPSTEKRIREAWKALDEKGISDSMPKGGYRPHVSLGVCDHLETDSLAQELSIFTEGVRPFRLSFPNIGIFSTSEGVVYLGATVTAQLLNVHTAFHEIFRKHAKEQRESGLTQSAMNCATTNHAPFEKRYPSKSLLFVVMRFIASCVSPREYYTVGQWVPHCTLAFGLSEDQIVEAVSICRQIGLPVSTEVKEIGVVKVSPMGCQTLSLFSFETTDSTELNDELRPEYDETLL